MTRIIGKIIQSVLLTATVCILVGCGTFFFPEKSGSSAIHSTSGLSVSVDAATGSYTITFNKPAWTFAGKIGKSLTELTTQKGQDRIGPFEEINFNWQDSCPVAGSIRVYKDKPLVLFSSKNTRSLERPAAPFPSLTKFPKGLYSLSYQHVPFAVPSYSLNQAGTPWLYFDENANAFIISPASNFMVASMLGDGRKQIACGSNPSLSNLPKDYTQKTILVAADGINNTWQIWGQALTDLYGKKRPANDAEITLKYIGYWTDAGASYYYKFDKDKGYEGTLLAVKDNLYKVGIPVKYMQIDSWFYPKSTVNSAGIYKETGNKNPPPNPTPPKWDNFGGLIEYTADKEVFPDGLSGFHKKLGLPLMTHNHWIDRSSPYHQNYKISGVGAVDSKWWNDIIGRIASDGVAVYEQDWLNEIYDNSPDFAGTTDTADAFMDNMAAACRNYNVNMQYCMALPCNFLQGAKYDNLTTIRICWDRFSRNRWAMTLYTSRLASALGIWPWVDVFASKETENMLLSVLSAGIVGISDSIGQENKDNIMRCIRSDGVIIKPDYPIAPTDSTYISDAKGFIKPVLAFTFTEHRAGKTYYVFSYSRNTDPGFVPQAEKLQITFTPSDFRLADIYVYDYFAQKGTFIKASETFEGTLHKSHGSSAYYIIAPVFKQSKIALFGDLSKFVTCGKKRIRQIVDEKGQLIVTTILADGEKQISLTGCCAARVSVQGLNCSVNASQAANGIFNLTVSPSQNTNWTEQTGEKTAELVIKIQNTEDR